MFSSPKRNDSYGQSESSMPTQDASATVIARGVKVEGDFTSPSNVLIEGEVLGHVKTSGVLTVGNEAKLKADVTAEEAVVAGLVEGNISVKKRLELKSTAKIMGDIACETVVVEAGAVLNGKVAIGSSLKESQAKSSTKSSAALAGAGA
jgi:cytoskeletal protein CcmA (bactofilin family)